MITRTYLRPYTAVRYSWKNILFSIVCASIVVMLNAGRVQAVFQLPLAVVAILGTALAIILGFRNASAYDRWWEARKVWGGVVNESRTLMRQVLTIGDPRSVQPALREVMVALVRAQLGWVNALRLQLRGQKDPGRWQQEVAVHLSPGTKAGLMARTNKVTYLGEEQGRAVKVLHANGTMDSILYTQLDNTLSRLTDLQGMAERIKSTPLPRPYDYYTMAFLNLFILFLPFGLVDHFEQAGVLWLTIPTTAVVGWIFFQIYVFGRVMASPFENWHTDVPLDAICTTIAIDLKEAIGDPDIPTPLTPEDGVLM